MNSFFTKLYISFLFSVLYISVLAIPASPYPIHVTQADGTQLTIRLQGDEYFHYITTLDGYVVKTDKKGFYNYAIKDKNDLLVPSLIKANNIENRTLDEISYLKLLPKLNQILKTENIKKRASRVSSSENQSAILRAYPLTGSPKSLVILVNFTDKSFVTGSPQTAFTNLLNQEGYNVNSGTGSARDYFRDCSSGVFVPQFDVVGPFTLTNNMAFYGENTASDDDDKNPQQMVIDACKLASDNGVNFAQYDTDNDGFVDNIFIYYAGYNEAEGGDANTIWPHRHSLPNASTKFNGKAILDYACTSELKGKSGANMCGIGTFCHEFGHVLGLADYYATNDATHQTLSSWNIMDYGAYLNQGRTPPTYSAYDRFFLKWLTPFELKVPQNVTLNALTTSNKAYIITEKANHNLNGANPNPVEFITIENRQKIGWDSFLPGHGMLVSRINFSLSSWNDNTVNNSAALMGYEIIQADGLASDANLGGDPFPGTSLITSYLPALRSGTTINKPFTFIEENSGVVTFRFMGGGAVPIISSLSNLILFNTKLGSPSNFQTFKVSGKKLVADIVISFKNNLHFEIKKQTDAQWSKSLLLTPVDSIVDTTLVQVRYNPSEASFTESHNEIIQINSKDAEKTQINISGKSTRPVYVVPPIATEATEISLGAFVANWESVFDASGYYLTVYSMSEGESQLTEGFDNGLTASQGWSILASAITSSTAYSNDSVPAIQFKTTGEYIQTEKYVLPTSGLTFFVRSMGEKNGNLLIEAWNGSTWSVIDNLAIIATLKGIQSYSFGAEKQYIQFRFTNTHGNGYLAIDDISVKFSQKIENVVTNRWLTATRDTVSNLVSNRNHYYKVRASDKTLSVDLRIKYENITEFSNIISVKTLEDKTVKTLRAMVQHDGTVVVVVPTTDEIIYVYNAYGQQIKSILPASNVVSFYNLPKNQVYILKAGERRVKIIL